MNNENKTDNRKRVKLNNSESKFYKKVYTVNDFINLFTELELLSLIDQIISSKSYNERFNNPLTKHLIEDDNICCFLLVKMIIKLNDNYHLISAILNKKINEDVRNYFYTFLVSVPYKKDDLKSKILKTILNKCITEIEFDPYFSPNFRCNYAELVKYEVTFASLLRNKFIDLFELLKQHPKYDPNYSKNSNCDIELYNIITKI